MEQLLVVRPEPAEERQVVGALEDVDAVQLQQSRAPDDALEMPTADGARGARLGEALGSQGDPARGAQGEVLGQLSPTQTVLALQNSRIPSADSSRP